MGNSMAETILIVEDEASIRNIARVYLEQENVEVICTDNGPEAFCSDSCALATVILFFTQCGLGSHHSGGCHCPHSYGYLQTCLAI